MSSMFNFCSIELGFHIPLAAIARKHIQATQNLFNSENDGFQILIELW